jgi:hypothetical protein
LNRSGTTYFLAAALFVSLTFSDTASAATSSDGLWQDTTEAAAIAAGHGPRVLFPRNFRVLSLNEQAFRDLAATAPLELTFGVEDISPIMTLPMPDGSFARFRIQESVMMEPQLAAKLSDVKTYRGQGVDDPTAMARLDFTPAGFHGFIRTSQGAVFIDPLLRGDKRFYMSYWRRDYFRPGNVPAFHCEFTNENPTAVSTPASESVSYESRVAALAASGATLRTYRLAMAATGEYSAFYGGTVPGAQAGIVTTINRVSGIFEQDLAIRMVLVDNTAIVFTNAGTDPYDNDSGDLGANQSTIDSLIGTANYDIGHLVGTGGGGVAVLQCVCKASKARGLTGSSSPVGDAFDVDYVAHEIGHQFGGNHTFNGTTGACGGGNRSAGAAYEPGSGTTIMAYAGICGAEDLQPHSDPYFHVKSFDEIVTYTTTGIGNNCPVPTSTGNGAPTVNAGAAITIPHSTPFYLTGSATDPNDHPLTYAWEQFNSGGSSGASTSTNMGDQGTRPIFRSFNPVPSPVRTFPKLSSLLTNTFTIGEWLPTTTRVMTFRLTARDNQPGGGGVDYASTTVSVTNTAGPFVVTAPNTAVSWGGGTSQNVTWSVANTTAAPVSCVNVKIQLSIDGGTTFPTTLLVSTPNDGTEAITVPSESTTSARIRVECATSPFFDISNVDFTIAAAINLNVIATATTATNVDVTWNAVGGAVSYEIHRRIAGGSFTLVGTSATPNFSDTTVSAGNAYLYAVKSVDAVPVTSALSLPDLATTFFFTDPTVTPAVTIVKAVHFTELRNAIAALRALANLSVFSYTDATLTAGVTPIKAVHLSELRSALDPALTALGFPAGTYTDVPPVATTTAIKAVHIMEIRNLID